MSERLRQCEALLEDVRFKEVPARLASLILRLVDSEGVQTDEGFIRIPTHYTHEQLDTIIGANRVAVSRAFSQLREAGAIEPRRRRIHVKDLEARERRGERRT